MTVVGAKMKIVYIGSHVTVPVVARSYTAVIGIIIVVMMNFWS